MKVAAIVPAYNEEITIGMIVRTLKRMPLVNEVIVVSDGSEDKTVENARKYGATIIELQENIGKGGAMKVGTQHTDADVYLFIDADLVGLTSDHIKRLLDPILAGTAQMTVGVFEDGRLATDLAQKIAPFLSGQRAITREVFDQIPNLENSRFGVEMALSRYADKHETLVTVVPLTDLSQLMKEEKRGLFLGIIYRLKMYWEILRAIKL